MIGTIRILALFAFTGVLAQTACAGSLIYTDPLAFQAALAGTSNFESFDSLVPGDLPSSLTFGDGVSVSYTISSDSGRGMFGVDGGSGDHWLATDQGGDSLVFSFSGTIDGVGGYFFATDVLGRVSANSVTVTLDDGTTATVSAGDFLGFVLPGDTGIQTLTVQAPIGLFATANDVTVAEVPEPATLLLFGSALLGIRFQRMRHSRNGPTC